MKYWIEDRMKKKQPDDEIEKLNGNTESSKHEYIIYWKY